MTHVGYTSSMLTIKTLVKESEIEGLGLFATEKIPKGTTVWRFDPRFDLYFEPAEVEIMGTLQKDLIDRYAYLSTTVGKYVYCADDARFMNHSARNNNVDIVPFPGEPETRAVASRDIEIGEEILVNYREIDTHDEASSEEYLDN